MLQVIPISAFTDNYIWALVNKLSGDIYVVDPGDAEPVLRFCHDNKYTLKGILITHHHWDHTNGVQKLTEVYRNIPVYGPQNSPYEGITHPLSDGQSIKINELGLQFNIMHTPGHTLDHIAFYNQEMIFCGDTLFNAGCGRLFEGTPEQMYTALMKIAKLPSSTKVYCTHEYTRANIDFAVFIEPENNTLIEYRNKLSGNNDISLPTTIDMQLKINPFLRTDLTNVTANIIAKLMVSEVTRVNVFAALRKLKDNF
jgi:hydroxyacylglutathione hydrolase